MRRHLRSPGTRAYMSVASLWEAAIRHRLGKLPLPCPLEEWPIVLAAMGVEQIEVRAEHAIAEVDPWPKTNDPFDRLLLAVAQVEDMQIMTIDRKLLDHPLAWRPA